MVDGRQIGMQHQDPGDTDGDRANPWTVLRKEEKFACPHFSVRSDTVTHGSGLPRTDHWLRLFDASLSPGSTDGCAQCFVAWGLHSGAPHPEPEERLVQRRVPFAEALSMALSGEISNFPSVTLLLGIQIKLLRGELPADLVLLLQQHSR